MGNFFALDWRGPAFELFGAGHLIALGVIVLLNVALGMGRAHFDARARRKIRVTLAVLLVANELVWHAWNAAHGLWTMQTMLPLHLCSVLVWLEAVMLVTGSQAIYEFAYLLGIAGALQALLTPDAGIYGFPHLRAFQVMLSHGLLVTAPIYLTVVEGYRPTFKSVLRVLGYSQLYAAVVFGLNFLLGSNYLYLAHKPPTASLLDVMPPWPWYILIIEALALGFIALAYAPFAWRDWRAARAAR